MIDIVNHANAVIANGLDALEQDPCPTAADFAKKKSRHALRALLPSSLCDCSLQSGRVRYSFPHGSVQQYYWWRRG